MARDEMRARMIDLLREARALRAAFPDAGAMGGLPVGDLPPGERGDTYRVALRYLRDEMLVVRAGKADSLVVLDDEIASVERLLADGR